MFAMPDGTCSDQCPQDRGLHMMYDTSSCECPHGSWPDVKCEEGSDGKHHCQFLECKCHGGAKKVNDHCQCEDPNMIMTMSGCRKD